jgi:hypothetical protein
VAKFLTREYSRFFIEFSDEALSIERDRMVKIPLDAELEIPVPDFNSMFY